MEANKYQRFNLEKIGQKSKDLEQLKKEGLISGIITMIDEGVVLVSSNLELQSDCCTMIDDQTVLYLNKNNNQFIIGNLKTKQCQSIQNTQKHQWENSSFQLFFFKQRQEICLVEKENIQKNKLKITHFDLQKELKYTCKQISSETLTQQEWNNDSIFKINEQGLLGWCKGSPQSVNLSIFSRKEGYKTLLTTENPLGQQLDIVSIGQSKSNYIHLCCSNPTQESQLPIIILETIGNFSQVKDVRTAKQRSRKTKLIGIISQVINIGDFFLIDMINQQKRHLSIYSFETESIQFEERPFEGQYTLAKVYYGNNSYCCWKEIEQQKTVKAEGYKLVSNNSLSILKMLQTIHMIREIQQKCDTVVLIFGAHISGKTTLRHFLAGDDLEFVQHEGGYPVVRLVDDYQKKYAENPEKSQLISATPTEKALLIEVPQFQNQEPFFQMEVCILMQQIFKYFKKLYTIITIPFEFIQESQKNASLITSVLKMIHFDHTDISSNLSIVLTKVEDEEQAQELFLERIEEIIELNQEIGKIVSQINDYSQVYTFNNQEPDKAIGQDILNNILNSNPLLLSPDMAVKIKGKILAEGKTDALLFVRSQITQYFELVSKVLLYLSHVTVEEPKYFNENDFKTEYKWIHDETSNYLTQISKQHIQSFIPFLFQIIALLKIFVQKKEIRDQELLRCQFYKLELQYLDSTSQDSANTLTLIVNCFMAGLYLSFQNLKVQVNQENYSTLIENIKSSPYSILSKQFLPVISKLLQTVPDLKQHPYMKQIKPFQTETTNRIVIKTIQVPMSYNEEKTHYLKQANQLKIITSLPSNAMKMDLMMQQLFLFGKDQVTDNNMREVRYYLRECSRICQFHKQYFEAIIFLMVIPDFLGIDLLLDDLVDHRKRTTPYQSKLLLSGSESELIGELIVLARSRVRDSLVRKLIHIQTLHAQSSKKGSILKKEEQQRLNQNLSFNNIQRYKEDLNQKKIIFYNLKNQTYKKVIANRIDLIEKCREYQDSKEVFEDIEALDWVVANVPTPI